MSAINIIVDNANDWFDNLSASEKDKLYIEYTEQYPYEQFILEKFCEMHNIRVE